MQETNVTHLEQLKFWITTSKDHNERKRLTFHAKNILTEDELKELNLFIIDFLNNEEEYKNAIQKHPKPTLYKPRKDYFFRHNNLKDNIKI